ncbi:hypothetical protein LEP1GSC073_4309 [Leptospira noguchii str. Cascata]|nr:hypothetical protein LEP1GSC073_4309 [Leptospira noguchii str. Cascata]
MKLFGYITLKPNRCISSFVCEGSGLNHLKHLRKTLNTT